MKKKSICYLLVTILFCETIFIPSKDVYAISKLRASYNRVVTYVKKNDIKNVKIEWAAYKKEYNQGRWRNISSYEKGYYAQLDISDEALLSQSASSGSSNETATYYYNTGTNMPEEAVYENKEYDLLNTVRKGDIIYEDFGGRGWTGHIAIVEGKFYDYKQEKYYIRIIEAIDKGVKRGILDDLRMEEKMVTVLRLKKGNRKKLNFAVNFSMGQLGKKYKIDIPAKDTSEGEKNWYCSELVWAAFKNQGIDIETTSKINGPGVTPRDIKRCKKLETIITY